MTIAIRRATKNPNDDTYELGEEEVFEEYKSIDEMLEAAELGGWTNEINPPDLVGKIHNQNGDMVVRGDEGLGEELQIVVIYLKG